MLRALCRCTAAWRTGWVTARRDWGYMQRATPAFATPAVVGRGNARRIGDRGLGGPRSEERRAGERTTSARAHTRRAGAAPPVPRGGVAAVARLPLADGMGRQVSVYASRRAGGQATWGVHQTATYGETGGIQKQAGAVC